MVHTNLESEFICSIYFYVFAEYTSIDKKQLRIGETNFAGDRRTLGIFHALLFEERKERQRVKERKCKGDGGTAVRCTIFLFFLSYKDTFRDRLAIDFLSEFGHALVVVFKLSDVLYFSKCADLGDATARM